MSALDYFKARLEATVTPMDVIRMQESQPDSFLLIDVRIPGEVSLHRFVRALPDVAMIDVCNSGLQPQDVVTAITQQIDACNE